MLTILFYHVFSSVLLWLTVTEIFNYTAELAIPILTKEEKAEIGIHRVTEGKISNNL